LFEDSVGFDGLANEIAAGEPRVDAPSLRGDAEEREDGDDDENDHHCLLNCLVQWTRPIIYLD